jgi:hypothetical protein
MENTGGFAASLLPVVPATPGRVISYNWDFYGTVPSDALSSAGVVPATHWNNSYPARTWPATAGDPSTSVKDNRGEPTTLDFHFSHSAQWHLDPQATPPPRDADGSYNKRLLKGYVDMSGGNPQTLTLSEIPYAKYDLYVYLSCGSAGREGYATDGTSTFHFRTAGSEVITGDNALLVQATETTDLPTNATATYARFANLTGSSQNLTVFAAGNAGIAGFQIVEIPDYEVWRSASGVAGSPGDDDDGDGLPNFEEYAFGLDPTDGSSLNPIAAELDKASGTFRYTRRRQSATGLAYRIWTSPDLLTWTLDPGAVEGAPQLDGEVETVPVTLSSPPVSPSFFVRVSTP